MDAESFAYLQAGILLGMHAGFAPGPVSTLIVTESLLHGRRAGMKIAFVPLLTDLPVIALIVPLLYYLSFNAGPLIGAFSMVGAVVLCLLGYESLTVTQDRYKRGDAPRISLAKAIFANLFNPNMYIYWIGICGPLCATALHYSVGTMLLFLVGFYFSITSVKIGMALAVGSVRRSLNLRIIVWINRLLGVVMFVFAVGFFWQGCLLLTGRTVIVTKKV